MGVIQNLKLNVCQILKSFKYVGLEKFINFIDALSDRVTPWHPGYHLTASAFLPSGSPVLSYFPQKMLVGGLATLKSHLDVCACVCVPFDGLVTTLHIPAQAPDLS